MRHHGNKDWWVLDNCPQLLYLHLFIARLRREHEDSDDENSHVGVVKNIHLDLPSLEKLYIHAPYTVEKCTLACPKLVDLEFSDCWRMVSFNFDGGERLQHLKSEWKVSATNSCKFLSHRPFLIHRLKSCSFISACTVGGALHDVPGNRYWANLEATINARQAAHGNH